MVRKDMNIEDITEMDDEVRQLALHVLDVATQVKERYPKSAKRVDIWMGMIPELVQSAYNCEIKDMMDINYQMGAVADRGRKEAENIDVWTNLTFQSVELNGKLVDILKEKCDCKERSSIELESGLRVQE